MIHEQPVPGIPGAVLRQVDHLPETLADGTAADKYVQARPGALLISVPGTGRFLARDGSLIEYAPETDSDIGKVVLFLNGSARGALIHQRGELPLHAATLVPPGGETAVAICGRSGAGKSTLAAELSRRGWILVADDTTRVTWDGANVLAWPNRDSIKLWKDACEAARIDVGGLKPIANDIEKYYLRVDGRQEPAKLKVVVELTEDASAETGSLSERMALITRNTYRPNFIRPLGTAKEHIQMVSRIASVCKSFKLRGGRNILVSSLADSVETIVG
jgi:hypothetical protein